MRLRPYIPNKDFEALAKWLDDERVHAFWCANLLPYPVTAKALHDLLEKNAALYTDCAFTATEDDGQPVGFFCYSLDEKTDVGFLKFIIVDNTRRGKGYGKEMLHLALQYAFHITGAGSVRLNVFTENARAKRCYEQLGFTKQRVEENVLSYKDEVWSRYNMLCDRDSFFRESRHQQPNQDNRLRNED